MQPSGALVVLVVAGIGLGVFAFVRLWPLATEKGQLRRKRQEIERKVSALQDQNNPISVANERKKPLLSFGCLVKWLVALGLGAGTAYVMLLVIGALLSILLLVMMIVVWGSFF